MTAIFSIQFVFDDASTLSLPVDMTPHFAPEYTPRWDLSSAEPQLLGHVETWNLDGGFFYNPTNATLLSDFDALRDALLDTANPPRAIRFKQAAGTVYEMSASAGYKNVIVTRFVAGKSGRGGEWANHIEYAITVQAEAHPPPGTVFAIDKKLRFEYDKAELLKRTLEGRIIAAPGEARAAAEAQGLGLPGATYRFVNPMPGGASGIVVTVEDHDQDSEATFSEVVEEFGEAPPAGVNDWDHEVESEVSAQSIRETTTLTATGPAAAAAVRSFEPAVASSIIYRDNLSRRKSVATFTVESTNTTSREGEETQVTSTREFTIENGGQAILWTDLTGGDIEPIEHRGKRQPFIVRERVKAQATGITSFDQLVLPEPPAALKDHLDETKSSTGIPHRVADGKGTDPSQDLWEISADRHYELVKVSIEDFADILLPAQGQPGSTLTFGSAGEAVGFAGGTVGALGITKVTRSEKRSGF